MQAVACVGLETLHEIVAAQEDLIRECRDREVVCEVLVDVVQDLLDLGIAGYGVERFELMVLDAAIEQNQEFNKEDLCVQPIGETFAMGCFFELVHVEEQVVAAIGQLVHDASLLASRRKALGELGTLIEALQEVGCDVDDDALVRCLLAVPAEHRAVDLAGCDEDDVIRLQVIRIAFDDVVDISAEEQDDLVEIVVMEGNRAKLLVVQMEDAEVAAQITLLRIVLHTYPSCLHHRGI